MANQYEAADALNGPLVEATTMKTSTIEVGELVSTLSAAGVHRQLSTLPGVHHADVNYVAGSATVHYDEAKITLDAIRQRVSIAATTAAVNSFRPMSAIRRTTKPLAMPTPRMQAMQVTRCPTALIERQAHRHLTPRPT